MRNAFVTTIAFVLLALSLSITSCRGRAENRAGTTPDDETASELDNSMQRIDEPQSDDPDGSSPMIEEVIKTPEIL